MLPRITPPGGAVLNDHFIPEGVRLFHCNACKTTDRRSSSRLLRFGTCETQRRTPIPKHTILTDGSHPKARPWRTKSAIAFTSPSRKARTSASDPSESSPSGPFCGSGELSEVWPTMSCTRLSSGYCELTSCELSPQMPRTKDHPRSRCQSGRSGSRRCLWNGWRSELCPGSSSMGWEITNETCNVYRYVRFSVVHAIRADKLVYHARCVCVESMDFGYKIYRYAGWSSPSSTISSLVIPSRPHLRLYSSLSISCASSSLGGVPYSASRRAFSRRSAKYMIAAVIPHMAPKASAVPCPGRNLSCQLH